MPEKYKKAETNPGGKKTREERLREALRANLQRRKAQGRARKAEGDAGTDDKT